MMSPEQIFSITNFAALPAWAALALAPLARDRLVLFARGIATLLGLAYTVTLASNLFGGAAGSGGMPDFTTLPGVMALFAQPTGMTVGWIHYLAFDLWVGAWAVEVAGKRQVPHLVVLPCLFFTFMFGPVGLLMFLCVFAIWRGRGAR